MGRENEHSDSGWGAAGEAPTPCCNIFTPTLFEYDFVWLTLEQAGTLNKVFLLGGTAKIGAPFWDRGEVGEVGSLPNCYDSPASIDSEVGTASKTALWHVCCQPNKTTFRVMPSDARSPILSFGTPFQRGGATCHTQCNKRASTSDNVSKVPSRSFPSRQLPNGFASKPKNTTQAPCDPHPPGSRQVCRRQGSLHQGVRQAVQYARTLAQLAQS